jgi:hypothetical protein
MKIRPVGAECHADGEAESYEETNTRFRNFAKPPKSH